MILENSKKFIKYFGFGKQAQLIGLTFLSLIAGGFEFLGIALIYPFILMIIRPESVINSSLYISFANLTGIDEPIINALVLGCFALMLFILKNLYMILFLKIQNKFVVRWKQDIANLFMKYFLYVSYKDVIKSSNSDKYYILNSLCGVVLNSFVMRTLTLVTNSIIVIMVVTLILIKFPAAGIVAIAFSLVSMFLQNKYLKKATAVICDKIQEENHQMNSITYSNINNIKEIKIIGLEDKFYKQYTQHGGFMTELEAGRDFYSGIPPYIVEMLIVISLLILGAFIAFANIQNQSTMVASFAIVVASIFRIAPALNRIQTSIINIGAGRNYLKALIGFYEKFGMENFKPVINKKTEQMEFNHKIEFKNICFSYVEGKQVLNNISFEIEKGDFIGIIGLSGSGKTTLADIFMGLLPPDSGEIYVDGIQLTEQNYNNFRPLIGYVPQEVKILEKSFKENIAWGVNPDEIDIERVQYAIAGARLEEFINRFEEGINAIPFIGSNGASQGQKQRIAIARVLYRNPDVLVLDEATSSLDVKIEHEITDMLTNLKGEKTIIAIAHRLSTLKTCNKLIYIKDGKLVDIGSFKDLSAKYSDFETLIKLSSIN